MTRRTIYRCDFCDTEQEENFRTITLEVEGWNSSTKHICNKCLDELGCMPSKSDNWKQFYKRFMKAWAR